MTRIWALVIIKALRIICNIDYKISGHHLPQDSRFIVACKHQSAWETIFFLYYINNPTYSLKKELLYLPIYGWHLKTNEMIAIDRSAGAAALLSAMRGVKRALAHGRSVVIFPEGTRVKPGELRECTSGIAAIYQMVAQDHPVIPVSLDSGKYWGKNAWVKYPGIIDVYIGEPLLLGMNKGEILQKVKDGINVII